MLRPHQVDLKIDVDEVAEELGREIGRGIKSRSLMDMECCIFKIPEEVSKHNDKAYTPYAFSIGPFFYSDPRTKATHIIKLRYLDDLLSRSISNGRPISLRNLIEVVYEYYNRAINHYDRPIYDLSLQELIKLLVLDGCFIIELFLKNSSRVKIKKEDENDPIFNVPRMRQRLNHDLVLLENQIPWIVLETLFHMTVVSSTNRNEINLVFLTLEFFAPLLFSTTDLEIQYYTFKPQRTKHILDLLRTSLLWHTPNEPINNRNKAIYGLEPIMLSSTGLEECGIKIQAVNVLLGSILNIRFEDGVLMIPLLKVNETTDALFRNLVSLELYCPNYEPIVTSYVKLFDDLVQTTSDMKLLCDKKVVHNMLRLEKATKIFNQNFEDHLDPKENYYFDLIHDLDKYRQHKKGYYMRRWRVYRRELKSVYFSHRGLPFPLLPRLSYSFSHFCRHCLPSCPIPNNELTLSHGT